MYSWIAFAFSAIIVEFPYNAVFGTLFYLIWYYTIGFYSAYPAGSAADRGIYGWLLFMVYSMWFSTFGQAVAAPMPNAETAAILNAILFSFVITFNGVLQPPTLMPYFWSVWMYPLTPFTYIIEGFMVNVFGNGVPIECQPNELVIFQPPSGQTCESWGGPFTQTGSGAIYNPNATADCEFCAYANGDQYLAALNLFWSHRWRDFGIIWYVPFFVCIPDLKCLCYFQYCCNINVIVLLPYTPMEEGCTFESKVEENTNGEVESC